MCPQEAKILIVDDERVSLKFYIELLEEEGHTIVARASSVQEAKKAIDELEEVDVGLFDGTIDDNKSAGEHLAWLFRKKFPGKPVLSISADEQYWSDIPKLTKVSGPRAIIDAVKNA